MFYRMFEELMVLILLDYNKIKSSVTENPDIYKLNHHIKNNCYRLIPFPLQYLTFSLLLVLISCGTYQMVISVLKLAILSVCGICYTLTVYFINNGLIYDQQDYLLQRVE